MPTFDFRCLKCGERFSCFLRIADRENVSCGLCGSRDIKQLFTSLNYRKSGCGSNCGSCSGC